VGENTVTLGLRLQKDVSDKRMRKKKKSMVTLWLRLYTSRKMSRITIEKNRGRKENMVTLWLRLYASRKMSRICEHGSLSENRNSAPCHTFYIKSLQKILLRMCKIKRKIRINKNSAPRHMSTFHNMPAACPTYGHSGCVWKCNNHYQK
jgi:hypothetical protein